MRPARSSLLISASTLFYRYREPERLSELARNTLVKGRQKLDGWTLHFRSNPLSTLPNAACRAWLRHTFTLEIWASQCH